MTPSLLLAFALTAPTAVAEEPPPPAEAYRALRLLTGLFADRFQSEGMNALVRSLERSACANIIRLAEGSDRLGAEDLWAVGECHAVLGDPARAADFFRRSLARAPNAEAHLGLARLLVRSDVAEADRHFAEAVRLKPEHAERAGYHQAAAQAFASRQDWTEAVRRQEKYLNALKEQGPDDRLHQAERDLEGVRLDRFRRWAAMTGQPAPAVKVRQWLQGEAVEPAALPGKVVVLDFCADGLPPSRRRMELLRDLHARFADKDVLIVGVLPEKERTAVADFAKKHDLRYRLGVAGAEAFEEYGVGALPQTVVLDRQGKVRLILPATDAAGEQVLERIIRTLLD
jgi:peroxiredoxin